MKGHSQSNYIITLAAKGMSMAALFMFQLILTHLFSVENFAEFSKWLVKVNYAILLCGLGLNVSSIYFTSKRYFNALQAVTFNVFFYSAIISMGFLLLKITGFWELEYIYLLAAVFMLICFLAVNSLYQSQEKYKHYSVQVILQGLFPLIAVVPFIFNWVDAKASNMMMLYVCLAGVLSLAVLMLFFIRHRKLQVGNLFKKPIRAYFAYGLKSLSLNFMGQTLYVVDIFILEFFDIGDDLAFYLLAASIVKLTWFMADTLGTVAFPRLIKEKKSENSVSVLESLSQFSFLVTLGILLGFVIFGKMALNIFYSSEYIKAFETVIILLLGGQGIILYKLMSRFYAAQNNWKPLYSALLISIAVNVGLNFILIPIYGIEGAAIASCISYWVCGIFLIKVLKMPVLKFLALNIMINKLLGLMLNRLKLIKR